MTLIKGGSAIIICHENIHSLAAHCDIVTLWRFIILSTFNQFSAFLDRKRGGSMDNLLDDLDNEEQMSADMKKANSASTKNQVPWAAWPSLEKLKRQMMKRKPGLHQFNPSS